MAVAQAYGKVVTNGLTFIFDTGDTVNSYKGEPTTNSMNFTDNVTGSNYGFNVEYSACQLSKAWYPNIQTPVGTGATLLTQQNSGSSPWYGLNWYDSEEDGKRCLSAYIYPVTPITQLRFGMAGDANNSVYFNIATREITYGAYITNTNAFIQDVPGYPGWLRVGANIEGRAGGWVLFLGTGFEVDYTPTEPYESFYICGIQYERTIATHCTQFTPAGTTRSATQGLLPVIGNSAIDLTNVSFDSNAQMVFDGTNDYVSVTLPSSISVYCLEMVWYNNNAIPNNDTVIGGPSTFQTPIEFNGNGQGVHLGAWTGGLTNEAIHIWGPSGVTSNRVYAGVGYHHIVFNWNGTTYDIWVDGVNTTTYYGSGTNYATLITATSIKLGNDVNGYCFNGQIPVAKIYNRGLTAAEVQQNYQKYKTRFNLS